MKRKLSSTTATATASGRHTLWVISEEQQDYLLEAETHAEVDIEPGEDRGLLRFYTACHYEQGAINESELDYLGCQALATAGLDRDFVLDEREASDYNQGTTYVFDHERFRITPQQLLKYRRSWFEVPVRRIVTLSGSQGVAWSLDVEFTSSSLEEADAIRIPLCDVTIENIETK